MTRRPRITAIEEADRILESLTWLRGAGSPNREVRLLFDCASYYRALVHRQGEQPGKAGFVEMVEGKRR